MDEDMREELADDMMARVHGGKIAAAMPTRTAIAGMALQGLLAAAGGSHGGAPWFATKAVNMADALLAELAK